MLCDKYIVSFACYANDNDAYIPELWAMESLAILVENMVMANLVHRDFSSEVAQYGDVVNTRRPSAFKPYRKTDADSITLQDAVSTNVQVPLNQHYYISFTIKDGESSKSFKDLVEIYLEPGMQGIGRGIDRMLLGQAPQFLANKAGKLGGVTGSNSKDYLLEVREQMNENLAYPQDRRLVLAPSAETLLLQTDMFVKANERGDGGRALEEARLGRVLGFDTFMDQNALSLSGTSADKHAGTANGAKVVGDQNSLLVTILSHQVQDGEFVVFDDDGQPTWATAAADDGTNTTSVNLSDPLKYAVTNASVVTAYGKVDCDGAYAAGYAKGITVDGYTAAKPPQVGQILAQGTTAGTRKTYAITEAYVNPSNASQTIIWLDRPLETALIDNDDLFPGPAGAFNLAFHRDAIALVSRPLALPNGSLGVRSQVASYDNIAMRVAMQYDITTQGTIVTLDLLAGVKVLDTNLGCVFLT
jgi:hypothetical protein